MSSREEARELFELLGKLEDLPIIAQGHMKLQLDSITKALDDQKRDYEEVLEDRDRLVRRLDVALHGEEGAAKQARLCDLVSIIEARIGTKDEQ